MSVAASHHTKQVDEVKGDARKKNGRSFVLELSKLLFSDALLVSLYSIDRSIRRPATMVQSPVCAIRCDGD